MGKNRLTLVLLFVAGVAAALALVVSGLALVDRFSQSDARRTQQSEFNVRFAALANANCHDIEALKTVLRDQENQNFRDLPRNLRLLGIKETPEVDRVASKQHSQRLARLVAKPCPRKPTPRR